MCIVHLYSNLTKSYKVFDRTILVVFKYLFSHTNRQRCIQMCFFFFFVPFCPRSCGKLQQERSTRKKTESVRDQTWAFRWADLTKCVCVCVCIWGREKEKVKCSCKKYSKSALSSGRNVCSSSLKSNRTVFRVWNPRLCQRKTKLPCNIMASSRSLQVHSSYMVCLFLIRGYSRLLSYIGRNPHAH